MNLPDILSGPVSDLLSGVENVIDTVSTTDEERLEAERKLRQLENQFRSEILSAQKKLWEEQSEIIQSEAESSHWLAANIRPLTLLSFLLVALYAGIFAPIFGAPAPMLDQIPPKAWTVILMGLGGYIGGRTAEKVIPRTKWAKDSGRSQDVDAIAEKVLQKIGDARS